MAWRPHSNTKDGSERKMTGLGEKSELGWREILGSEKGPESPHAQPSGELSFPGEAV